MKPTTEPQVAAGTDSHAPASNPRPKPAPPTPLHNHENLLDVCAAVPLHQRPVVTYAEAAALGIAPERTLRRLVAIGRVKRAVLRIGRSVKFVVHDLLDELRGAQE